jgi:hypothetical protein
MYKCDVGITISDGRGVRIIMKEYQCSVVYDGMLNMPPVDDAFVEAHSKWGSNHSGVNCFLPN